MMKANIKNPEVKPLFDKEDTVTYEEPKQPGDIVELVE